MKKISILSFLCILTILFASCNLNFSTFNKTTTNPDNSDLSLSVQNSEYNAEGDNSYLVIGTAQTDNSFAWYQSEDNLKDNYYKGNCAIYTGQAGMDYVTKDLKAYGVTEKELERVVKDKEKFIVIHVQYSDMMINGVQQIDNFKNTIDKKNPQSCAYYGQIEENGNLYLVNMMTATPYSFKKKDTTSQPKAEGDTNMKTEDIANKTQNNTPTTHPSEDSRKELGQIIYAVPDGYSLINNGKEYTLYGTEGDDTLRIYFFEGTSLDAVKKANPDGKEFKIKKHDAYKYIDQDYEGTKMYCVSVLGNGGEYIFQCTSETDLDAVVNTVAF